MSIGSNISKYRKLANLSQTQLAAKVNVTQPAIAHYEGGYKLPSILLLIRIADVLEVTVDMLVRNTEGQEENT